MNASRHMLKSINWLWAPIVFFPIYQLQAGQQVLAGLKVVQSCNQGCKGPALSNSVQSCDNPVTVVMDIKRWTRLLKDQTSRSENLIYVFTFFFLVQHINSLKTGQTGFQCVLPSGPVQDRSFPATAGLFETVLSPECNPYCSPPVVPKRQFYIKKNYINNLVFYNSSLHFLANWTPS